MSKPAIQVVAAVIERDEKYLLTQRQSTAVFPFLWEFPGGRVESGESDAQALLREVRGRIDVEISVGVKIGENLHEYRDYDVRLNLYSCVLSTDATPRAKRVRDFRWVASTEFDDYEFPPADQRSMTLLLDLAN